MDQTENRQIPRDSLTVVAELRVEGLDQGFPIRVRNLSPAGMMGEGQVQVVRGAPVRVNIRDTGWVEGVVAWVQDDRFGIAFQQEINPKRARTPIISRKPPQSTKMCVSGAVPRKA